MATIEDQIITGVAHLLGIKLYRLRSVSGTFTTGDQRLELQATSPFGFDFLRRSIYIRVYEQRLEFYAKQYRPPTWPHEYLPNEANYPWVLMRLDLTDPRNLTRAKLRASIKESIRLRDQYSGNCRDN